MIYCSEHKRSLISCLFTRTYLLLIIALKQDKLCEAKRSGYIVSIKYSGSLVLKLNTVSVSYTHLDVYKRQLLYYYTYYFSFKNNYLFYSGIEFSV